MTNPLVSIIVPFCNEEKYIADAINSLLEQTYSNIEIVLVDDHSTDNSKQVCISFKDPRVKYFPKFHIPNGRAWSRNFGIEKATGEIITFLDADDTCSKDRIEFQLNKLKELGMDKTMCGCWVQRKGIQNSLMQMPVKHEDILKGFTRQYNRTTIVGATIMAHKNVFLKYEYRTKFKFYEDWDLLVRLGESNEIIFVNIDKPLYTYMIRSKGTKFQKDWLDYNIFMRDCQIRRVKNLPEYESPDEMFAELKKNNKTRYLAYKFFEKLVELKRYLRI